MNLFPGPGVKRDQEAAFGSVRRDRQRGLQTRVRDAEPENFGVDQIDREIARAGRESQ